MVLNKVRAWLVFFRAHTAILETPLAVLGAAAGLGTLFSIEILWWALFGVVYHFVGYGMNSYVDWKKGYDKEDPRKQHHPLNTGEISEKGAKYAVFTSLILLISLGEYIADFSIEAHISISVMLVAGMSYNYFGKITKHKYIPISVVHTMVFVFPFIVYHDGFPLWAFLITNAIFVHHTYQIAISGDVKDIDQDESSLIQNWGAKVERISSSDLLFYPSTTTVLYSKMLVATEYILLASALAIQSVGFLSFVILSLLMVWHTLEAEEVVEMGYFNRDSRLKAMSKKELAGLWMICSSVIPIIGIKGFLTIILLSLVYFFPISKFMWGNWIKPEV